MYSFHIGQQTLSPSCCVQESRWKKIIWLENQSLNSLRMLKSLEKKNLSHNTNYLWRCARFKLPQRGNISLVQSKSYGDCVSLKYSFNTKISLKSVIRMLHKLRRRCITWQIVFLVRWVGFVVKQGVVKYITTKLGGGTTQLMMLLKQN